MFKFVLINPGAGTDLISRSRSARQGEALSGTGLSQESLAEGCSYKSCCPFIRLHTVVGETCGMEAREGVKRN